MTTDGLAALADWPRFEGPSTTRALVRLHASRAPAAQVLSWTREVGASAAAIDVGPELAQAVQALSQVPPDQPLGANGTATATDAVRLLADRLEQVSTGADPAVRRLRDEVRGTHASPREVARAMRAFARELLARDSGATPSFSLILARSSDHEGAVELSLRTQTKAWRTALQPPGGGIDRHAAIILPPAAEDLVERVARQLDLDRRELPGVVFLGPVEGGMPADFEARLQPTIWTQWAFLPLEPADDGGAYPDQLRRLYHGVYGQGALFAGTTGGVVAERAVKRVRAAVSPFGLAKLLLIGWLGPGGGEILDLVELLRSTAEGA